LKKRVVPVERTFLIQKRLQAVIELAALYECPLGVVEVEVVEDLEVVYQRRLIAFPAVSNYIVAAEERSELPREALGVEIFVNELGIFQGGVALFETIFIVKDEALLIEV
jgi:hypothetical protein